MAHSFQMQKAVDKQVFNENLEIHRELPHFFLRKRCVYENLSRSLREGKGEHVGRVIFAPVEAVEAAGFPAINENKRKLELFAQDSFFYLNPINVV